MLFCRVSFVRRVKEAPKTCPNLSRPVDSAVQGVRVADCSSILRARCKGFWHRIGLQENLEIGKVVMASPCEVPIPKNNTTVIYPKFLVM